MYCSNKDFLVLNNHLNEDVNALSEYFVQNELLVNVKKNKTEAMLFGTHQRISKLENKTLNISCSNTQINNTNTYKYLGVELDSTLQMTSHFDKCYKKASSRLNFLKKIRHLVNEETAKTIYDSMIAPTLSYCSLVNQNLTNSQIQRLKSFDKRVTSAIVNSKESAICVQRSILKIRKFQSCMFVKKTLNNMTV